MRRSVNLSESYTFGTPPIAWPEQLKLIRRAQRGDAAARDRVLRSYVPLVVREAGRWGRQPAECDDLAQIGLIETVKAIEDFDPRRQNRLSTMVMHYIRNAFRTARCKEVIVRVPLSAFGKKVKPYIAEARGRAFATTSLDGGSGQLADSLMAPGEFDPAEISAERDEADALAWRRASVRRAIDSLDARMATIIRMRLAGYTLLEVGHAIGVTRERVLQLETRAMETLRGRLEADRLTGTRSSTATRPTSCPGGFRRSS